MTKNASHVVVHHYFDGSSNNTNMFTMTCCIVLSVIIVIILLIILVCIIYIIILKSKRQQQYSSSPNLLQTMKNTSRAVSNCYKEDLPNRRTVSNPLPLFGDQSMDINSNVQTAPNPTFIAEADVERRRANTSDSSAGLCEILFPPRHEGEVIYKVPPKVVAFAGRVFPAPDESSRPSTEPIASRFGTRARNSNSVANSLDWDYFESRRYGASNASTEAGFDGRNTVNVCWV